MATETTAGIVPGLGGETSTNVAIVAQLSDGVSPFTSMVLYDGIGLQDVQWFDNTEIADTAFASNSALVSISGSPVLQSVGTSSFSGCVSLTFAILPAVTSISADAFSDCPSLESISLPSATSIGSSAFYSCSSLESISLPSATSIGGTAFYNCSSLESISLPLVTSIGSTAF